MAGPSTCRDILAHWRMCSCDYELFIKQKKQDFKQTSWQWQLPYININLKTYKGSRRILKPFLFLLLKNNVSRLVCSAVNVNCSSIRANKDKGKKSYQSHAPPPGTVCSVQRWVPVGSYETLHPLGMLSSTYRQGWTQQWKCMKDVLKYKCKERVLPRI